METYGLSRKNGGLLSVCFNHVQSDLFSDVPFIAIAKLVPGFSVGSNLHPQSICDTCRRILLPLFKDINANLAKPPVLVDWDEMLPRASRSSGKNINNNPGEVCPCGICDIARLNGVEFNAWHKAHSRPAGTPPNPPVKNFIKRCGDCYAEIGPGKPHTCNKTQKRANLTGIIRHNSANTQTSVVANSLKSIAEDQGASTRGGEVSLQSGGPNKLLIKIGKGRKDKREERIITHEDLKALQSRVGCSDKKLLDINQFLASVLGQKKLEPYLKDALTARNKELKEFFKVSTMTFTKGPKAKPEMVERTVITADIPALVTFLIDSRGLDPDNHTLQLGLDSGQSILKICLLVREAVGEELGKF